jgi:hypothetical protein
MNEITVNPQMTFQEYAACQDALLHGKGLRLASWAILASGAVCLAASAALTWATAASILDGLGLTAFATILLWNARTRATARRQAYIKYRDSEMRYTFSDEQILATSRYAEVRFNWAAIDQIIETGTVYLMTIGNSYVAVTKRSIPPSSFHGFTQLLGAHAPRPGVPQ